MILELLFFFEMNSSSNFIFTSLLISDVQILVFQNLQKVKLSFQMSCW